MNEFNYNILRTVLPFLPSTDYQNRCKSWCKDEMRTFSLITPRLRFLPFQIVRTTSPSVDYDWELWKVISSDTGDDGLYQTINFPPNQIDTASKGGYDYITYFGSENFGSEFDCGMYYIYWTDGEIEKVSEVFHILDFVDDTSDTLIKYATDSDLVIINLGEDKIKTV